ncbi:hypothetical protein GCM10023340_38980 [Nocardioides marinquilinus]|uniref:Right-handed parallel beta-helix repeat-containing protein n=2 Tax=Nocardioides marinquilinus TaxID=1210400 RepID=A0ABP9Q4X2_9ACTN
MTTLTLVSDANVETGIGQVVSITVMLDDLTLPSFVAPGGRRLKASSAGGGVWTATWATEQVGNYGVQITAAGADPLLVTVTVVTDGPVTPPPQVPIAIDDIRVAAGKLAFDFKDGSEFIAGDLPVGPGGSDAGVASYVASPNSDTREQLDAAFTSGGEVRSKVKTNGTNQRATLLAELTALEAAGGGTLVLPAGTVTIASNDLTLPTDGATPVPKMNSLRLRGQGSQWASRGAIDPQGGTVLHFTGPAGAHAAIRGNGVGLFQLDDLTMQVDNGHFIHVTNTVFRAVDTVSFIGGNSHTACDQDVFVGGGTQQVEGGAGWDDGFQGYGSTVTGCFFNNIRRAVYGRAFFNGVVIRDNTVWNQCGTDLPGGAAFEIDGQPSGTGGQSALGNVITGNLIEMVGSYVYAVRLHHAINCTISHNNIYDANPAVTKAGVYLDDGAQFNLVVSGAQSDEYPITAGPAKVDNTVITPNQARASYNPQTAVHRGPIMAISAFGQGFANLAPSGDAGIIETLGGPFPEVAFRTAPAKSVTNGATTSGSPIITSATAGWNRQHEFMPIKGAGIPAGTLIARYISATSVELSALATATATGVTFSWGSIDGEAGSVVEIGVSRRHLISKGAIGNATGLAAAAFEPATATGTDTAFQVSVTPAAGVTAGDVMVVAPGINWAATPKFSLTPRTPAAAALNAYIPMKSNASNIYITTAAVPTVGALLVWDVVAIQ